MLDNEYGCWIRGTSPTSLYDIMARAKAVVTFNGILFDLPFLRTEFPNIALPTAHIDLRFFARRAGLAGPQKEIEEQLKFRRPRAIAKLRGETAPLLWHDYVRGDKSACEQLILYNKADIDGMRRILDFAITTYATTSGVPASLRRTSKFTFYKSSRDRLPRVTIPSPKKARTASYPDATNLPILLGERTNSFRVVGIDLTGSERRPTGWALIADEHAVTQRLATDSELIEATLGARPTIVSIDSPLSLPRGRVVVTDDDPGRNTYGIMRECERVLKKRGVNVYPSLIQSMQALTARGIRLAAEFRSRGIPVIESFPGAAQDIMGIPRKRQDLRLLAKGLHDFGVKGRFTHANVSHDELDAITSAIVGVFFWSGHFEALGNPDEEYLIIPSRDQTSRWRNQSVIGLSGPIYAGKTTAGEYLATRGYYYTRFSLVLAKLLEAAGETPTRDSLQRFGFEVRATKGQRWLDAQLVSNIPASEHVVIDGLRWPEDYAYMIESFGPTFRHVYLDASEDVRRARHVATGGDNASFDSAREHPVEAQSVSLMALATLVVNNNSTVAKLQNTLADLTL